MKGNYKFIFIIAFFVGLTYECKAQIGFIEEYIDFKLDRNYFYIQGVYVFVNPQDTVVKSEIYFPFDKKNPTTTINGVYNLKPNQKIPIKKFENGIFFLVQIFPHDTVKVCIAYQQKAIELNRYILTSTQSWGRPLDIAKYTLEIDFDHQIDSVSYMWDNKLNNVYHWNKRSFMPERDFVVKVSDFE